MRASRSLLVAAVATVLSALAATDAAAQRRVTGRVTDQDSNLPIIGASVTLAGSTTGAVSDENGAFALTVPDGAATLLVRRIGYKRQTVSLAADQTTASVALAVDVLHLETQVVTGAATSVARRNAANDIGQVSADQLERVPAQSVENALAGKVAGMQVIANSGAPGGGNQVRLRGVTSVFGSADPLYVVDGVIVSNDAVQPGLNALTAANRNTSNATNQDNGVNRIADLNPNDIESIEVLKGASASAIYGSKASNGVIIITTRRGDPGRTRVDVVQRVGTYGLANKHGARRFTLAEAEAYGAANGLAKDVVDANYASCGGFCDFEQQLFGEHPVSYETNLSVRGGTQGGTSVFASGLVKDDGGIQRETGYRKQALRLNLSQLLGSKLTLQLNNNLIHTLTKRGISNNDNTNITPYFIFAGTPSWYDLRPKNGVYPTNPFVSTNPFQDRDFIRTPEEVYRFISSLSASFNALATDRQSLVVRADGGLDRFNQQDNIVSPRFLYFEGNDGLPGTVTQLNGNGLKANANLSAIHTWTPASRGVTATTSAGVQREISTLRSTNIVTRDVLLGQENVDRGASTQPFAYREEIRGLAFYGQEELLAMNERLLLTGGARAERSTVNGAIDKFYWFPKASVSYRLSNPLGFLDELKPRLAVGQSGNLPLFIQKYSPAVASTYAGENALQVGTINGNPHITPERQTEIEGGFDAEMLRSRAALSLTLYQKTISDVILHVATAPSLGYVVAIVNGGRIRNRGVEALWTMSPWRTQSTEWVSRVTFARNVGVVTALPNGLQFFNVDRDASGQRVAFGPGYGIGRLEVGKRVTQIVATDATKGTDAQGNPIVVQKGDAAPDFTMGFQNEVGFRKFRLSFLVDWQHGGDLVNVTMDVYDAFALSPDRPDGGASRANLNDAQSISQYVQDASFVKLREVALSYELPVSVSQRLFFNGSRGARLEFAGRNLHTWTKYKGTDPEVSNFGSQQISRFIDLAPYPPSRSFFFTINVSY